MTDIVAGALPALRGVRLVAGLQLRRRLRDRSALLQGVVAPIVLAVIIAAAFGGGGSFSTTIGVVDLDGGDGSGGHDLAVGDVSGVDLVPLDDRASARAAIDDGDVAAAIVVPEGFAASLDTGGATSGAPRLEVLVDPGQQLSGDVALAIAGRFAAGVDTTRIAVATAVAAEPTLAVEPGVETLALEARSVAAPVSLGASAFGEGFDPITYFAPSMAILFAFLTLGAGARALIVERRDGTLARIRSTPIADRAVLAGVTSSVVVVGVVSFVMVWLVTTIVFGADWGDPAGVAIVIGATVVAVAGISTLVTGLARTEAQADGASSVLGFGFALVGGGFLSPGDLPEVLARIALITPNRWALDAFAELGAGATGVSAILVPVLVLTGIGLVSGGLGLRLVRLGPS